MTATGKWICDTQVFGNDISAYDYVYIFNPELWDVDSYMFNGFDGETSLGWMLYRANEEGEMDEIPLESFELSKGDVVTFEPADGMSGLNVAGEVEDVSKPATWVLSGEDYNGPIMNPYPIDTTLADIETFAVDYDYMYVFNPELWDIDSYMYNGAGNGWSLYRADESGELVETPIDASESATYVILRAGENGVYEPADSNGRTWTVDLSKK